MAKRRTSKRGGKSQELPEENEIDSFHSNQEKILLQEAGEYGKRRDEQDDEDEEVMRMDSGEDDDEEDGEEADEDDDEFGEDEDEEEEKIEGWGGKKAYYGGDEVDDGEAARHMAEEAIRQQKKQLQELGVSDYVDDDMMEDWEKKADTFHTESVKPLIINEDINVEKLDKSEKLELLTNSFPEFIPLLKELNNLKPLLADFALEDEISVLKRVSLTAYLSAISSYFSIFVDQIKNNEPFSSMKEHPVMESILTSRQIWKEVEKLEGRENGMEEDEFVDAEGNGEVQEDDVDVEDVEGNDIDDEEGSEEEQEDSEEESEEEDDETLNIDISKKRTIKQSNKPIKDDFTESVDEIDQEEKKAKRKTLRFYTAKIDKSQIKTAERFSGDLDLPYKERLFERKQRLLEEARKRGQSSMGDDLDNEDMNQQDQELVEEINNDSEYYDMIKQSKLDKTESRKLAHKQAVQLAKEGKLQESAELLGKNGKRALNFQIMKNKGLTTKKRKEVRNARVKKRNKHEKAQKKLKSVRQVYEQNKGPYEGEKTGIKKGLSRSVKLV